MLCRYIKINILPLNLALIRERSNPKGSGEGDKGA